MIPKNQPDVNPESPTTELSRMARQLPMHVVGLLVVKAIEYQLSDGVLVRAIERAVEFQNRPAHRCAACYRWMDAPDLPLACLVDGAVRFAAVCARCERRLRTTERITRAIEGYVRGEGQS